MEEITDDVCVSNTTCENNKTCSNAIAQLHPSNFVPWRKAGTKT